MAPLECTVNHYICWIILLSSVTEIVTAFPTLSNVTQIVDSGNYLVIGANQTVSNGSISDDSSTSRHPSTGLLVLECPVVRPSIPAPQSDVVCQRGWTVGNNEDSSCSSPDYANIVPCTAGERNYQSLVTLRSLSCHQQHLNCLGDIVIPGDVQNLSLKQNSLSDESEFKEVLSHLEYLVILDVQSNDFMVLPNRLFEHNLFLEEAYFDRNLLRNVPEDLFVDTGLLMKVSFAGNSLNYLPWFLFAQNSLLTEVDFSRNNISSVPIDLFYDNPNLEVVKLSHNSIEELPAGIFVHNGNLTEIYLSGNNLKELFSGLFDNLSRLRVLRLSYNSILRLPENFLVNCPRLQILSLSNNQLASLPRNWLNDTTKLQVLDLSYNRISTIPRELLQGHPGLTILGVGRQRTGVTRYQPMPWYESQDGENYRDSSIQTVDHERNPKNPPIVLHW